MTKKTGGGALKTTESYKPFCDGYRDDVGTEAVPITTESLACFQVLIQNDPSNQNYMYVGNQHSQSVVVESGQSEIIPYLGYANEIYVRFSAGSGQRVNWHVMG